MPADTTTTIDSHSDTTDSPDAFQSATGSGRRITVADVKTMLDALIDQGFEIGEANDAAELFEQVEQLRRLADVASVKLLDEVQRSRVFYAYGHSSAKVMAAHHAKLSGAEAAGRDKVRRMTTACDHINRQYENGNIGVDQMRLLGRAFANRRTRQAFISQQGWFVAKAQKLSYKKFQQKLADWVELNDQDGTQPDDLAFLNRDAAMIQDAFTGIWHDRSNGPSLPGAQMREIFDAYIEAEFHKDWNTAKAIHGDDVTVDLLARTDAQRRFDAKHQIYLDAAANPNGSAAANVTHNIIWDHATFEEMLARYVGADPAPFDIETFRCSTIDGWRIKPSEALVDSLINGVRRVIIDAASVTIDMSHKRFYTGLARLAAQINHDECEWPGCHVPISRCQADHIVPHSRGGPTHQCNHGGFCRRHNRLKETGYTVWRNPTTGQIHITTPTGDQIQ